MLSVASRAPDGVRIAYDVHGAGEPAVVLIHGWCCNRTHWRAQVAPLARRGRVVALDLAGHGESSSARTDWTTAAFGADVAAVVDDIGATEVILVGHSMGADVALEAARVLPDRVRGIVWIDQYTQLSHFMGEAEVAARVAPFRADFAATARAFVRRLFAPDADPALVARVSEEIASTPETMARAALGATWNHARNVPALLRELRLPVVAINARDPGADLASLQAHGVAVLDFPEAGHFPMLEKPAAFTARLATALDLIGRRAARNDLPDLPPCRS